MKHLTLEPLELLKLLEPLELLELLEPLEQHIVRKTYTICMEKVYDIIEIFFFIC